MCFKDTVIMMCQSWEMFPMITESITGFHKVFHFLAFHPICSGDSVNLLPAEITTESVNGQVEPSRN